MSHSSFSALFSTLSKSQFGCRWDEQAGFTPLEQATAGQHRIVLVSQLISEYVLTHILRELKACVDVNAVMLNPQNALTSSFAVDLYFDPDTAEETTLLRQCLTRIADTYRVDLVLQHQAPKLNQPGLLVMDMDSTMIQIECIDEIARLAGRYDEVAAVTAKAMNGKLAFAESLTTRVACLRGVEESALAHIKAQMPLMPGLWQLVKTLKQHQWRIAIASGGFTYFADYLKAWLELDEAVSNTLDIDNGVLTGNTIGRIVDASVKADTLNQLRERWQIEPSQTVAMGDGANDLAMLGQAAMGVAFHAKASVREQADQAILFQPLDALLLLLTD